MAADIFSSFLGMTLQGTGNNNNAWGVILNGSALQTIEKAIAGNISRAVTGGTLDLSGSPPPAAVTQALEHIQIFTGTLAAAQIVIMPNLSKTWFIYNGTTGAFPLTVKTTSGTATQIPAGTGKYVVCDGSNGMIRLDRETIGDLVHSGGATRAGALVCDGASKLKTDFPDLYAVIGTTYGSADSLHFTIPNLTDTGRFLRSKTGSVALGTYQSNQNKAHTHTGSGTTATGGVAHTHTFSGTTGVMSANASHTHSETIATNSGNTGGGGAFGNLPAVGTTGSTNTDHTHTYSGTTSAASATDHTHTYSFTTSSDGGTEARPEALSVTISIVY